MNTHPSERDAATDESAAAIRALINAGADINSKDERGRTPLHIAALNDRADAVSALIAAGADVNAKDERGQTPLHLAADRGHAKTAKALTDAGDCPKCPETPPDGGFWVYENDPTNRARVHRADCKFCNHGDGVHGRRNPDKARWHGPFTTIKAACDKMRCLGKKDSGGCGYCKPCAAQSGQGGLGDNRAKPPDFYPSFPRKRESRRLWTSTANRKPPRTRYVNAA